jgi:hypothetical protein
MSTSHVKDVFGFLNEVCADSEINGAAMKVAYAITQFINWETGVAFPSLETLAEKTGLYPYSVRRAVKILVERGHIGFEPGKQGRGHPNRYWLLKRDETGEEKKAADREPAPSRAASASPRGEEADLFRRGKEVLGQDAGGLIAKLLKARDGNIALARAVIELASTKQDPREYVGAVIHHKTGPPKTSPALI